MCAHLSKKCTFSPTLLNSLAELHSRLALGKLHPFQLERFLKQKNPFDGTLTERDLSLTLMVDYGKSLTDWLAEGHYSWLDPKIQELDSSRSDIPVEPRILMETEVLILHFASTLSSASLLKRLRSRRLRPATICEFLAVGANYPDLQRRFPIYTFLKWSAESSTIEEVLCLLGDWENRNIHYREREFHWPASSRFAAVSIVNA